MLGEAVTFDSSRELRPTPNTSFFLSLNLKWQYTTLKWFIPSYAEELVIKKILVNPFSQRQNSRVPACSCVCTLGGHLI